MRKLLLPQIYLVRWPEEATSWCSWTIFKNLLIVAKIFHHLTG